MESNRTVLWFGVFTATVLLVGAALGVLADRHLFRPRPWGGGAAMGMGPGRGGMMGGRGGNFGPGRGPEVADRLMRELTLTPAQADSLHTILERRRQQIEKVRGDMRQRMEAEQKGLRDEIRAMLRPDQQKRFDELMARAPGPWPGMRGGPGPMPPDGPGGEPR